MFISPPPPSKHRAPRRTKTWFYKSRIAYNERKTIRNVGKSGRGHGATTDFSAHKPRIGTIASDRVIHALDQSCDKCGGFERSVGRARMCRTRLSLKSNPLFCSRIFGKNPRGPRGPRGLRSPVPSICFGLPGKLNNPQRTFPPRPLNLARDSVYMQSAYNPEILSRPVIDIVGNWPSPCILYIALWVFCIPLTGRNIRFAHQ